MHLKKVTSTHKGKTYEYAQIVKSVRREDGKSSIETVKSLGRMKSEEDWERARKIKEAMERDEKIVRLKDVEIEQHFELGLSWVAKELWDKHGIGKALMKAFEDREHEFNPEKITFMLAVNRLYRPGSDLSAYRWIRDRGWPRIEIEKQWNYRTLDPLVEEKEEIEENILQGLKKNLDLDLSLVFYDLTSSYFEGEGPKLAKFGYSRDKRKDKKQLVLGVVMAGSIPIAHRVWPGNTDDSSTLEKTVQDLKKKFGIEDMVFVADRGVFKGNLEDLDHNYIGSVKKRKSDLSEKLLPKNVPGSEEKRAAEIHSEEGKRYVLCLDEDRREKDLKNLEETVEECKSFLEDLEQRFESEGRGRPMTEGGAWKRIHKNLGRTERLFEIEIDGENRKIKWELNREPLEYEKAIAGKFLLVTTTDLKPDRVMKEYKNLKDVERAFDDLKNLLKLRPVRHRTNKRARGHVFICVLSLLLEKLMEKHTDRTFESIKEKLEPLKTNQIEIYGEKIHKRDTISPEQEKILDELHVEKPPKILVNV
jgi:transposase